jgi:hypothetical protein
LIPFSFEIERTDSGIILSIGRHHLVVCGSFEFLGSYITYVGSQSLLFQYYSFILAQELLISSASQYFTTAKVLIFVPFILLYLINFIIWPEAYRESRDRPQDAAPDVSQNVYVLVLV